MSLRDRFPIFQHHPQWIYLDSAATAHKPDCVIQALSQFYARDYATVHRAAYRRAAVATELYHAARKTVARFLNARDVNEIVFTRGTTDAINLIAKTFPFQEGDEILLSELEHHSNLIPWQMVAKEKKLVLKWIRVLSDGTLDLSESFSERTKLVAITHVSNVTGTMPPLSQIIREAHRVGAVVFVDGAQAAPHCKLDMRALDADFYAFSGHKCYGPTGIGVLYGKERLLAALPPLDGGGDMVDRVEFDSATYQAPPLRFEAGTPIIGAAIGLKAALEFLEEVGLDWILAHEEKLLSLAMERLTRIEGLRILGRAPQRGPLLSFSIDGVHPLDLAAYLDTQEIAIRSGNLCAQPLLRRLGYQSVCRASFGLYNREEEIELFAKAVSEACALLNRR